MTDLSAARAEGPYTGTVRTTGLAGGLLNPYKGLLPACARKAH